VTHLLFVNEEHNRQRAEWREVSAEVVEWLLAHGLVKQDGDGDDDYSYYIHVEYQTGRIPGRLMRETHQHMRIAERELGL
jgi:hypothetical protein